MGGSAGFLLHGYAIIAIGCVFSGIAIGALEWWLLKRRASWLTALLSMPIGLLLSGVIFTIFTTILTGRDFPSFYTFAETVWAIGFSAIGIYTTAGLISRWVTVGILRSRWEEKHQPLRDEWEEFLKW